MNSRLSRLSILAATLAVALSVVGSALANPSMPVLHPIPSTVTAIGLAPTYTLSWDGSTFDPFLQGQWWWHVGYGLTVQSYPIGQPTAARTNYYNAYLSFDLPIESGRHYIVWAYAYERNPWCDPTGWIPCEFYSAADTKAFDVRSPSVYLAAPGF